jgi:hypothetical protein
MQYAVLRNCILNDKLAQTDLRVLSFSRFQLKCIYTRLIFTRVLQPAEIGRRK